MNEFPRPLTEAETTELRRRQSARNKLWLVLLFLVAALFYAISMVRFKVS